MKLNIGCTEMKCIWKYSLILVAGVCTIFVIDRLARSTSNMEPCDKVNVAGTRDSLGKSNFDNLKHGGVYRDRASKRLSDSGSRILITGYKRSGSTFLGRLLGARADTFYWHEPLRFLRRAELFRAHDLICQYETPSCKIKSKEDFPTAEDFQRILAELFDCNFTSIATAQHLKLNNHINSESPAWSDFRTCAETKTLEQCIPSITQSCKNAKHHIIKTVRLDLITGMAFLKIIPSLQVLHLVRDPRGVINSRLQTPWYKKDFRLNSIHQIEDEIKVLCSILRSDLSVVQSLNLYQEISLNVIQYESFANLTDTKLCKLFTALEMDCSLSHMNRSKNIIKPVEHIIHTKLYNEGNHPYVYRDQLAWNVSQLVNTYCFETIKGLGFKIFKSEKDLRNLNLSVLTSPRLPFDISG